MKITIPQEIKEVLERISNTSYHAYIVGGAVRDRLIGRPNDDYDLCTDMPLEEVKKLFPGFTIMKENDHRNTGIIRINGLEIEISSIRGNSLKEDLSKRDFTMNAIACDKDGNIIDYFGGVEDIQNKKISLVDKEGQGIDIDPIRILRALRFQGTIGFEIDQQSKEIITNKREKLNQVAPERVYKEVLIILTTDSAPSIIRDNKEIFTTIIPELKNSIGFQQNNDHHIYDVFEHTLKVLENTPNDPILRLAALFHDIGKPFVYVEDENKIGHFYEHAEVSAKIFKRFAEKYKMDLKTSQLVKKLIIYHDRELSTKSNRINKFLIDFGIEGLPRLLALKRADVKGQNPKYISRLEELDQIESLYRQRAEAGTCLTIKDLKINGRTLMSMGFFDRTIGIILKDVLNQVADEKIENTKESLEEYVSSTYK